MKNIILLVFAVMTFSSCNTQKAKGVERITIERLKSDVIGKDVQLIDVRTSKEYANGHIDDAVNINIANVENFKTEVLKLDKTQPVYLYCQKGGRSNRASKVLKELGFETVYDFPGGWKVWSQQ